MTKDIQSRLLYPNPFAPVGIEFALPESGFVTVKILDQTGYVVNTVIEHKQYERGKHLIPIDIATLAKGNYLYQLLVEINGERIIETKKI